MNNNGHSFVDLGLPSGTLWSTQNVGASTPSDSGLYFQWGDTKGYTREQIGYKNEKKAFTWADYKFSIGIDNESNGKFSKYATPDESMKPEDDAAHVHMGGDWHIPSPKQIKELINTENTRCDWIVLDGISGVKITSKKDKSKSIFIPAAGFAWEGSLNYNGNQGYIWSSMLSTSYDDVGQCFSFSYLGHANLYSSYRHRGFSVRGVIG